MFLCSFYFPSSLVFYSCGLMTIFSVVFELIFPVCLCFNCRFFCLLLFGSFIIYIYIYICIYIYINFDYIYIYDCFKLLLSYLQIQLQCPSFLPTFSHDFWYGGIIVHGCFHTFTVYIPLLVICVICGNFVSCCDLFFSA